MNTPTFHRRLSPQEHAALMDEAKLRAVELRREAVDEFWSAVAKVLRRLVGKAQPEGPLARPHARNVSY